MDSDYFICAGDGDAIELKTTQHFYNEQRQYLVTQHLSGRYDVSARYAVPFQSFHPISLSESY